MQLRPLADFAATSLATFDHLGGTLPQHTGISLLYEAAASFKFIDTVKVRFPLLAQILLLSAGWAALGFSASADWAACHMLLLVSCHGPLHTPVWPAPGVAAQTYSQHV